MTDFGVNLLTRLEASLRSCRGKAVNYCESEKAVAVGVCVWRVRETVSLRSLARSVCGGDSPIPVARLETSILKSKWDRNESLRRDLKMFAFTVHWDYRIRLLHWDYEI